MARINILSENVRNMIAAGEVIERPVSVVKELVENSIDAGSTAITVSVENGGKDLIQVIDNGHGMSPDDAMLALESHATSKIRNVEDIVHIDSLGFRGEALPSIASISGFSMLTRSVDHDVALRIDIRDGKLRDVQKTSSNPGTTIWVRGLFKSLPARRKFLRSSTVELRHILKYFHYQAVLYPEISFKLIADGRERLNYISTQDRNQRMAEIFGSGFFTDDIIEVENQLGDYYIEGYIFGLEERTHKLVDAQYVFINGRFISDKTVRHSIRSAYEPFIQKTRIWMKGQTPPYILFLSVPPTQIDINVSPTKNEVRFRENQKVHSFIFETLSKALRAYEDEKFASAREKFSHPFDREERATTLERDIFVQNTPMPKYAEYKKEHSNLFQADLFKEAHPEEMQDIPIVNPVKFDKDDQSELFPQLPNDSVPYKLLLQSEEEYINPWQLHNTYIFVQVEDGLVIIDQHAAHERIVYEKLIHRVGGAPAMRQKLIIPLVIDIPPYIATEIRELIDENMELLTKVGFMLKKFSGDSIVIEEIPAELGDFQGGQVFIDILQQLETEMQTNTDFRDSLAKSIACKAAVKANEKLSRREMLDLINNLFACQVPYFCPHGRPLIVKMTLADFEKKFKRTL